MLQPDLDAGDVLLDLFDEGQMLSQLCQALVRLDARLFDRGRTGGDKNRIELVILGPAQMHPRGGHLPYDNCNCFSIACTAFS